MKQGSRKLTKIFTIVIAIIVVICAAIWTGMWITTKNIESVANQFKPDSSWKLENETFVPSQLCLAWSGPCPRIERTWSTPKLVNQEQLSRTLSQSGWNNVKADKDCTPRSDHTCSVSGRINGFNVTLYVSDGTSSDEAPSVYMHLE